MRSWEHDLIAILRAKGCADFALEPNGGGHITVSFRHGARIKIITVANSPNNESAGLNYFRQAVDRAIGRGVKHRTMRMPRAPRRRSCKPFRAPECPCLSPLPDWHDALAPLLAAMREGAAA